MIFRIVTGILCLALGTAAPAIAQSDSAQPSVLVQVMTLNKGRLPRIVTGYGSVKASTSARETIMAPVSAVVAAIYVRQGEQVAKGAPLIRLEPSPKTKASYAQAQSALGVAKELVSRTRKMLAQHLATEQQLANAEKAESDAQSSLAALQAQGAGGANILRAPTQAIVTTLSTIQGAIVAEGATLLDLAQPEGLVLAVGVTASEATGVTPGDRASITAIGDQQTVPGRVMLRGSIVDSGSALVPIEISLPPGKFLPGEMGEAAITTGEVSGYVVPHEAVLVNDRGEPYVVQAVGMRAREVPVRILAANDGKDVIDGRLEAAAPLVLAGNYQLENGMRLRLADPKAGAEQ